MRARITFKSGEWDAKIHYLDPDEVAAIIVVKS